MSGLLVVFKKELKDSLRDRRALLTAMLPAIFGPVMMMTLFSSIAEERKKVKDLDLPVIGQEHAPDLIAYLAMALVLKPIALLLPVVIYLHYTQKRKNRILQESTLRDGKLHFQEPHLFKDVF